MGTRTRLVRLAASAAMLLPSLSVLAAQPAEAAIVPNQLVCSTSTGRCYQANGRFDSRYPCHHAYNVGWAITSEWPTYGQWRYQICRSWV